MVHHLVHIMRTGGRLKASLKGDRSSVKKYQVMLGFIHQFQAQQMSETQKNVTAPQQRQPLDDLTVNLQQLFLGDEDEETVTEVQSVLTAHRDLALDHMLSVRTRYRTKERNNRCNKPEIARKQECRGWDLF